MNDFYCYKMLIYEELEDMVQQTPQVGSRYPTSGAH